MGRPGLRRESDRKLASDESGYATGANFTVDGDISIR